MKKEKRGPGWPADESDIINKYGTYEVQETNGMANEFPMIAQGLSGQEARRLKRRAGKT